MLTPLPSSARLLHLLHPPPSQPMSWMVKSDGREEDNCIPRSIITYSVSFLYFNTDSHCQCPDIDFVYGQKPDSTALVGDRVTRNLSTVNSLPTPPPAPPTTEKSLLSSPEADWVNNQPVGPDASPMNSLETIQHEPKARKVSTQWRPSLVL